MQTIFEDLPQLYKNLLPDLFSEIIPRETLATCQDCTMCSKSMNSSLPGIRYYSPDTKCCTFFPSLPNYLVGGILQDNDPELKEGSKRMRKAIERRVGVLPQGIFPGKRNLLEHEIGGKKGFGLSKSLLCPYYNREVGTCSIWKYREATCSSWFCKYVGGEDGRAFWSSVRIYLKELEQTLIYFVLQKLRWRVNEINYTGQNADNLEARNLDETRISDQDYEQIWHGWMGNEEAFYKKAFDIVRSMSKSDLDSISGIKVTILVEKTRYHLNRYLHPSLPLILKRNPAIVLHHSFQDKCIIETETGVFEIPSAVYNLLEIFDGTARLDDLLKKLEKERFIKVRRDFIVSLYQHRILLAV